MSYQMPQQARPSKYTFPLFVCVCRESLVVHTNFKKLVISEAVAIVTFGGNV